MGAIDSLPIQDEAGFFEFARSLRIRALDMIYRARSSHIGSCFSMAEILSVLYGGILQLRPGEPDWKERDRLVLSKGHACAILYAALSERGFFPLTWLESFCQNGSRLAGHATHALVPGVEASTGSLGHGLSLGCGMAIAGKWAGSAYRVVCILSDGECDEGSIWEAALFAQHHKLDNLMVIVDYNKIQSLGTVAEVLELAPLAEKWRAFGWTAIEIDGHSVRELRESLGHFPIEMNRPSCVIAHTVKGKGVSFMEHNLLWHYRSPDAEEFARAMHELGVGSVQ